MATQRTWCPEIGLVIDDFSLYVAATLTISKYLHDLWAAALFFFFFFFPSPHDAQGERCMIKGKRIKLKYTEIRLLQYYTQFKFIKINLLPKVNYILKIKIFIKNF